MGEMRILVNGYFYGGNCPPFVHALKQFTTDVKITNALGVLDEHGINLDYLDQSDIIRLRLNWIEKMIVVLCKKAHLPMWKVILTRKAEKVVAEYMPDIIVNHKASEKAEIMLRTGFRPQVTYIYGGEVHGSRIKSRELDYIFKDSAFILTTTEQMRSHINAHRRDMADKTKVFPLGYFELERILEFRKNASQKKTRTAYGFSEEETVFLETRSLRGEHAGLNALIQALRELAARRLSFKFVFLRGYLGTDRMAAKLMDAIREEPLLARHIVFVNEIITEKAMIDYYFLADAFVSILPADQSGKCINDAVFLDCSLILSDLEVYRERLGDGPCYIQNQNPIHLAEAFVHVIAGGGFRVTPDFYHHLLKSSDPGTRFENLSRFLHTIVKGVE